jgi:hypothetical protein
MAECVEARAESGGLRGAAIPHRANQKGTIAKCCLRIFAVPSPRAIDRQTRHATPCRKSNLYVIFYRATVAEIVVHGVRRTARTPDRQALKIPTRPEQSRAIQKSEANHRTNGRGRRLNSGQATQHRASIVGAP